MPNLLVAGNSTNGGTAITTDTSGTLNIVTGSGLGSNAITIDTSQNVVFSGNVSGVLKSGTAVASTSGTSIDFTGIPAGVKRVTVMLNGVSVSGTSSILVQLGTSGGIQNTGYVSAGSVSTPSGVGAATSTAGFLIFTDQSSFVLTGNMTINNQTSTTWLSSHTTGVTGVVGQSSGGGVKSSLSGTLDRVRITTVNGTDTFDAGTVNILWE